MGIRKRSSNFVARYLYLGLPLLLAVVLVGHLPLDSWSVCLSPMISNEAAEDCASKDSQACCPGLIDAFGHIEDENQPSSLGDPSHCENCVPYATPEVDQFQVPATPNGGTLVSHSAVLETPPLFSFLHNDGLKRNRLLPQTLPVRAQILASTVLLI